MTKRKTNRHTCSLDKLIPSYGRGGRDAPPDVHFFASSCADWHTSVDYEGLLKTMRSFGYPFAVYFVPVPMEQHYSIQAYRPDVEGSRMVATYGFEDLDETNDLENCDRCGTTMGKGSGVYISDDVYACATCFDKSTEYGVAF